MKALCKKIWRLLNIDVLFLSLVEKLARGLSKKLTSLHLGCASALNRIMQKRNAENGEPSDTADEIASEIVEELIEAQA